MNRDEAVSDCRYVEKKPGQFVADTSCEKLPKELCGKGELAKTWLALFSLAENVKADIFIKLKVLLVFA